MHFIINLKSTVFCSLIAAVLSGTIHGQNGPVFQADTIRAVGEFLNRISNDIEKIQHTRQRLTQEYDSLVGVISRIKVSRELNFLRRMRLKRLLRLSEETAVQIGRLNKVQQLQVDMLAQRVRPAIVLMENEIEERIASYRAGENDTLRAQIVLMLKERARMLHMLKPTYTQGRTTSRDTPGDGEYAMKADFALDLADRMNRRIDAIDFELGRVHFGLRLRNAYLRQSADENLPAWKTIRGWMDPWLTDRRLEFSGYDMRSGDDLLVREYKLRVERDAILEQRYLWHHRALVWQQAAESQPDE